MISPVFALQVTIVLGIHGNSIKGTCAEIKYDMYLNVFTYNLYYVKNIGGHTIRIGCKINIIIII